MVPTMRGCVQRDPLPRTDAPGTLAEQMRAIAAYLDIGAALRRTDRAACWMLARRLTIAHARRREGVPR